MIKEFTKGLYRENPIFVILLGLCPTLAVSTQVINALGMGAGVVFVLLGSNLFVSLLKDFIPEKVRIPIYIVIIATFVTIVDLAMQAWVPSLSRSLGVFVPGTCGGVREQAFGQGIGIGRAGNGNRVHSGAAPDFADS